MIIGIDLPIFSKKSISKSICDKDIHTLEYGIIIMIILHIYGSGVIFFYFMVTKTPDIST